MKKLQYIFLLIVAGLTSSCELDLQPESTLTYNGFWEGEEAARAAHVGLYASFRDYHFTLWGMGEIRSDIWGGATVESPSNVELINQNISATMVPYANWANFYGLMHRINDFLYHIEDVPFSDEAQKEHMIGQVYGLRAYIYYTMLKSWGGVPLTTEPLLEVDPSQLAKGRASREEVMDQIKSDIARSLEAFGSNDQFWTGKRTYWSKAATLTLKGDVYIWSGNLMGGGTADFEQAKSALEQVQNMNVSLVENYEDLWGEENEINPEFIFQFDYTQDQASNFYSGQFTGRSTEINAMYDKDGNSMADFVTNGGNRYGPSEKILEILDNPLDKRGEATFITLFSEEGVYQTSIMKKFLGGIEAGRRLSNNDVPLYRYADVLLLLAEAKNHLGLDPSQEINQIRARAYGSDYDPTLHAFTPGSFSENANAILDESLKEFIGEGKRWWDLRRAGPEFVYQEIQNMDPSVSYKLELPISLNMLSNNPYLEQTPGYE